MVLINVPAGALMTGGEGLAAVPTKRVEFREALALCLEYAQGLNVESVNVLPGRCLTPDRKTEYLATFKTNIQLAADQTSEIGVRCTFEAINSIDMPGSLVDNFTKMVAIHRALAHPNLFMQYDWYHTAMMEEDILTQMAEHLPHIGHIQFADLHGRGQPGSGHLDFSPWLQQLVHTGY